jgi:hypothetical protein
MSRIRFAADCPCPEHDEEKRDRSDSLRLTLKEGKLCLWCFGGCSPEAVLEAAGLTTRDLEFDPTHRPDLGEPTTTRLSTTSTDTPLPPPEPAAPADGEPAELPIHPAAEMFPPLGGEEFRELKEDVRLRGLREPIVLHDGKILDGRNRYRACRELGVEPKTVGWDGVGTPEEFVLSMNLLRRHLTASQRACIATRFLPALKEEAKERQRQHGGTAPGRRAKSPPANLPGVSGGETREKAARVCDVSPRYDSDAKKIKAEAPEVFEEMAKGKTTVSEAKRRLEERGRAGGKKAPAARKAGKSPQKKTPKKPSRRERAESISTELSGLAGSLRRFTDIPDSELTDAWPSLQDAEVPSRVAEIDRLLPRLQAMLQRLRELGSADAEPAEPESGSGDAEP